MGCDMMIQLSGAEFALVNAAAFLIANWPFETQAGRSAAAQVDQVDAESLDTKVSTQWIAILGKAGLWQTGDGSCWTETAMRRRAQLSGELVLTREELARLCIAVKATINEFSSNWSEFLVVAPGNIESYALRIQDFARLLLKLECAG